MDLRKKPQRKKIQILISTTWHNNESVRPSENALGILNEFFMFSPPPPFFLPKIRTY